MSADPALVAISHGTSSAHGQRVVQELAHGVEAELRTRAVGAQVVLGHVDVQQPDVPAVLGQLPPVEAAVVVPLLLSAGFHVKVDLREALENAGGPTVLAPALGPDDRLVQLIVQRLEAVGADPESDVILLGAAGSSDPSAAEDCREMARRLSEVFGAEVHAAFLAFASPRVPEAVEETRRRHPDRRIIVASYLLAPGFFQGKLRRAGADITTTALLDGGGEGIPDQLVEIVVSRYLEHRHDLSTETPQTGDDARGSLV